MSNFSADYITTQYHDILDFIVRLELMEVQHLYSLQGKLREAGWREPDEMVKLGLIMEIISMEIKSRDP